MRKMLLTPLILCMIAFLSMLLMPAVSASSLLKSKQVIVAKVWDDPDPDLRIPGTYVYWSGPVDFGGCMRGTAYFGGDPTQSNAFTGNTIHFYEYFYIAFDNGGWIQGHDNGVYNYLSNWMYMANGWVTDASPDYAYLIGCKYFEEGKTTDPFADVTTGTGFCFLALV